MSRRVVRGRKSKTTCNYDVIILTLEALNYTTLAPRAYVGKPSYVKVLTGILSRLSKMKASKPERTVRVGGKQQDLNVTSSLWLLLIRERVGYVYHLLITADQTALSALELLTVSFSVYTYSNVVFV